MPIQLSVSLLPSLRPVLPATEIAVVIDVLRATSVMTTALAAGAKRVETCQSVDEARRLATQSDQIRKLLCGERACKKIEGFDLGNSPAEYASDVVQGRTLVLTTTNGTLAIEASAEAQQMVVASFLNLSATIQRLREAGTVHLICAGTNGQVTAEDVLLAGAICEELNRKEQIDFVGDDTILARQLWLGWMGSTKQTALGDRQTALAARLAQSQGGRNLVALGYHADLQFCAQIDRLEVVPERISSSPATFGLRE
jgi:2-phosphosulfolactate phosphatase